VVCACEFTVLLTEHGFRVVVTARDGSKIADLAGHRDTALALRLDVTDRAGIAEL
jgi:NADP-dependent 3-hydroxy acid dehydrogenase YdfG